MISFNIFKNTVLFFVLTVISCANLARPETKISVIDRTEQNERQQKAIVCGANQTERYLSRLQGKRVGIVANQTSVLFKKSSPVSQMMPHNKPIEQATHNNLYTHLVDSLLSLGVEVKKVFAPEHGFRGTADAGEIIKDGLDIKTNLPTISLYGKNKKPKQEQLHNLDVVLFDIQDVGVRFYTYISTLHYVMEACSEANIPVIILDRPNPNGHYIDGPVLEKEHSSFVGMHPIPVVHGMTIGEYAQMINGEKWLANGVHCKLEIIPIKNYTHHATYDLPIKPSPNLPTSKAVNLYPSLCFFEGTTVSVGRGTIMPFEIFGSPHLHPDTFNDTFTPISTPGAKHPLYENKLCYGKNLNAEKPLSAISLKWLIKAYKNTPNKATFFNSFFTKLAGTKRLQQQIEEGLSESEIKNTWHKGLEDFKRIRNAYVIYK